MSGYIWDRVDAADDPVDLVAVQQNLESWRLVRRYRERMRELTGTGRVLDVGAGPAGEPAFVGVDNSLAMCRAARDRGRRSVLADAAALSLLDGTVDAVRADRVFQHLPRPRAALAEAIRVVRPGGRIVTADPDQCTLTIEADGSELASVVVDFRRRTIRNPELAHRLVGWFADAGLADVTVDAYRLELTDPDLAFGITGWGRMLAEEGRFSDDQAERWQRALRAGDFRYAVSYLVTSGRRSGAAQRRSGAGR